MLMSLGFGLALTLKNVSASGWSAVEAAPKRSVLQLSLWLSCHAPPLCRWSVPGPQYARTS